MQTAPILLVLGPSGVGKSTFGEYLASSGWVHWEIDQFGEADGIDRYCLRREWNLFYEQNIALDLAAELCARIAKRGKCGGVLSFPSTLVLSPDRIAAASQVGIQVAYLFGPGGLCLESFVSRERLSPRNLSPDHWRENNRSYLVIAGPDFSAQRIEMFDAEGKRKPMDEILREVLAKSG